MEIDICQKVRSFCHISRRFAVFELNLQRHLPWLTEEVPRFITEIGPVGRDSRLAAASRERHVLLMQIRFHLLTLGSWLQCRAIGRERTLQTRLHFLLVR